MIIKKILNRLSFYCEKLFYFINRHFSQKGMILMYHHVTDEKMDVIPSCICTIKHFTDTLLKLRQEGCVFISIDELNMHVKTNNEIFVVVTFDDGCKDVYLNAYPILKELKIPFIIYLTNDYINQPGYMTMDDILLLSQDELCTIGYHTRTHKRLISVCNYVDELMNGKVELEEKIGKKILYFAYPYGKLSEVGLKAIRRVSTMGYENAVGTIDAPLSKFSLFFKYYLPRMVV